MQLQNMPGDAEHDLFNCLIDQFEEDIVIVDCSGTILNLNKSVLNAWGGTREDFIGKTCEELGHPEFSAENRAMIFTRVLQEGKRVTETYTELTPDERMQYYHVNAFPLHDKGGNIRRLVLTRRNTTEEMQLEQRLYQSQKMAAIGELATYLAHEIRNPLFAIGGFANALLRIPTLDAAAREKAQIILEEARRLEDILKSVLNFARPTEQEIGAVNVNELASQTVALIRFGSGKPIPIVLDLAENLPKVHGNPEILKQCLLNLIKNAQEAMNQGTIQVSTRYIDGTVYLEVSDNGPGIPQELQEKIFSPFYSTKAKGAGLGLAMTRKIINEIGGKILLHSKVGTGTLVSISLRPILATEDTPFEGGQK